MKRFCLSVLLFILACAGQAAAGNSGKTLDKLWKKVENSMAVDRPQKTLDLLEDVISAAKNERNPVYFCRGLDLYRSVSVRLDWKRNDSIRAEIMKEAEEFGCPVAEYCLMVSMSGFGAPADTLLSFASRNEESLKADCNREFYTEENISSFFLYSYADLPEFVRENISDDYEYVMWTIACLSMSGAEDVYAESCRLLYRHLPEDSINRTYLEFFMADGIDDESKRIDSLEKFSAKYAGRAISLYARRALLKARFNQNLKALTSGKRYAGSPEKQADSLSEVFSRFRKDCIAFEGDRTGYSGPEAGIAAECGGIEGLIRHLDEEKAVMSQAGRDTVCVILKNLKKAEFQVYEPGKRGKLIFSADVKDDSGHYFVPDTFRIALPDMDDGNYVLYVKSGKNIVTGSLKQYSVSGAYRFTDEGLTVFAGDFMTGQPLSGVRLEAFAGDSLALVRDSVDFSGFVCIGDGFAGHREITRLVFSYRDSLGYMRKSGNIRVSRHYDRTFEAEAVSDDDIADSHCRIFRDRSVFIPGDTVHFKAVLYSSSESGISAWKDGRDVEVILEDASGTAIGRGMFSTDGFGAVAGSFVLPSDVRRGWASLSVMCGGRKLLTSGGAFRVEDIVLPTYSVDFDTFDGIILPGDSVSVAGKATSYTGHPVSGYAARYTVKNFDALVASGDLTFSEDGTFRFSFQAGTRDSDYDFYQITLTITGTDGETNSFDTWLSVSYGMMLDMVAENAAEGKINGMGTDSGYHDHGSCGSSVSTEDIEECIFRFESNGRPVSGMEISYTVSSGHGKHLLSGTAVSGKAFSLDFSGLHSGEYVLEAEAPVRFAMPGGRDSVIVVRYVHSFLRLCDGEDSMDADVESAFRVCPGHDISLQAGAGRGPVWAVAELFDGNLRSLRSELVHLDGISGKPGSLKTLVWEFDDSYPDDVLLVMFYFREGKSYSYSHTFSRHMEPDAPAPAEFISFTENIAPGAEASYELKAIPDAEALVAVFDSSSEDIAENVWSAIGKPSGRDLYISTCSYPGSRTVSGYGGGLALGWNEPTAAVAYAVQSKASNSGVPRRKAAAAAEDSVMDMEFVNLESDSTPVTAIVPVPGGGNNLNPREEFSSTLAFIPFLKTGADSTVRFSFRASDKLSTYVVSVFVHDTAMRNNVLRREMLVSKDIMVSMSVPQFLYEGDRLEVSAAVSNASDTGAEGILAFCVYDGADRDSSSLLLASGRPVNAAAGGQHSEIFTVNVPSGTDTLGLLASFNGGDGDGIFVTIPVFPAEQTLTEAHSAVLLSGMSEDSLYSELRDRFVNVSGHGAEFDRRDLYSMLLDAMPSELSVDGADVLTLVKSLYSACLSESITGKAPVIFGADARQESVNSLASRLEDYACPDGGFGWFAGMESSPVVTACVLDMLGGLKDRVSLADAGISTSLLEKAATYLDSIVMPDKNASVPGGGISLPLYLHVRSMYPEFDFSPACADSRALRTFRRNIRECLDVRGENILYGRILAKAERISAVMNLACGEAKTLAEDFGLSGIRLRRLMRNAVRDLASLVEYAVPHASGGMYYPNAVMPFRGLMESELYAHSLLCDLLSDYSPESGIADGIRIWIMVQKETQDWDDDPAFVRAAASVADGISSVGDVAVLVMKQRYVRPFSEISPAGNGMGIERKYYVERHGTMSDESRQSASDEDIVLKELKTGDILHAGDIVTAVYSVSSDENRSFVRIDVPHSAALRPLDQLSGLRFGVLHQAASASGGTVRALYPYAYREVRSDRTVFWFDNFPEEESFAEEKFIVVHEGSFVSPAEEIECLYAPHYRANGGYGGRMDVGEAKTAEGLCE